MAVLSGIQAGARITAAMLRGVAPLAAYKTVNTTMTSSTTYTSDPELLLPNVPANAVLLYVASILYSSGTASSSDFKYQMINSAGGGSWEYQSIGYNGAGATTTTTVAKTAGGGVALSSGPTAGAAMSALSIGTFIAGSVGGPVKFQWAQNTSSASTTTLYAGSFLMAWQVA